MTPRVIVLQVETLVNRVLEALNQGFSIVIGLTSTGEASALRAAAKSVDGNLGATEKQVPVELFECALEALAAAGGEGQPI